MYNGALTAVGHYDSQLETKLEARHAQAARHIHNIRVRVSKAIIFYKLSARKEKAMNISEISSQTPTFLNFHELYCTYWLENNFPEAHIVLIG